MTSQKKTASNRANSKCEHRAFGGIPARTRYNAVTHGMRSAALLLPGENGLELDAERETWVNRLQPRDPAELELVLDYVKARWFHGRAERSLFQCLKADIEQAAAREAESVAGDICGLFSDAQGGHHSLYALSTAACGGPTTSKPTGDTTNDPNEPSILVNRLESSERGCLALTEYWKMLRTRLENGWAWQPQDRLKAIRMLGRQPLAILEDQRILLIYSGCFALHPAGMTEPLDDLKCELSTPETDPFLDRVRKRWPLVLETWDTPRAKEILFDLVDRNIERLAAKVEVFRSVFADGAASLDGRSSKDSSTEADRLKRYEHASDRRAKKCLEAFYKFRREMGGEEEDGELRAEDGGRRAEDGGMGRRAEGGGRRRRGPDRKRRRIWPESGVVGAVSTAPEKNLTSEANGGLAAPEAAELKEVAACEEMIKRGLAELHDLGVGACGTPVAGNGKGLAAIAAAINARGPLLRPIS